jgi:hypothetical protein
MASKAANERIFFEALLEGHSWAEAAWMSIPRLSFVNTVVGDPLMEFAPWIEGDFDINWVVGLGDFSLFIGAFGLTEADPGFDPMYDLDASGYVGLGDFSIFAGLYGDEGGTTLEVPEPATAILAGAAALMLLAQRRSRPRADA